MAKKFTKFSQFSGHLEHVPGLEELSESLEGAPRWASYAAALGAIEQAQSGSKRSKKLKKRHRKAVKAVRKLARLAGGPKAVRPPKRIKRKPVPHVAAPMPNVVPFEVVAKPAPEQVRPTALDAPRDGRPDNLQDISGIGPKLEGVLNGLGFFHHDQIAGWTVAEVEWIETFLQFKGRVGREKWIEQARALSAASTGRGSGR